MQQMKTIGEILEKDLSVFTKLMKKSQVTQDLAFVFQNVIDADLAKHCHFANLEGSVVTVTVTNAAWATRLRYAIPDLIKTLRTQPEFKTVASIRYLVNRQLNESKPKKKQTRLSSSNEILWQETLAKLKSRKRRSVS
ncbi:MAG: hypothetical protein ACD_21C00328G0011 [uncultured bacterium]|nr:MAG: hypothetical protein ACD_21C00328G0011 [uncultured bacterium]